jgi:mono/diheme cytochrome c family protein
MFGGSAAREAKAGPFGGCGLRQRWANGDCSFGDGPPIDTVGGSWFWVRSPEEEKRVVMGLFNRYCIRCHGVDGRGIWDIPDVPNFTNPAWQAYHTDRQLVNSIIEGRGSVMPPWRGVLSLEEAWAMARYIRTLVPGTEVSRPDFEQGKKSSTKK